jgi:hypothetical protein
MNTQVHTIYLAAPTVSTDRRGALRPAGALAGPHARFADPGVELLSHPRNRPGRGTGSISPASSLRGLIQRSGSKTSSGVGHVSDPESGALSHAYNRKTVRHARFPARCLLALLALSAPGASLSARAQTLPSEPLVFGGGRVALGGNISGTFGCARDDLTGGGSCADDTGFFNYTDYEHSALRMLRLDLAASVNLGDRLAVLSEFRSENADTVRPYALYVRLRPWPTRGFALQAGRVPPTFGAFARRLYPSDNPLVGYPLAYQYLTSLRADALPANADELLRMRGRGWLSSFSIGSPTRAQGVPLVSAFRWDTGLQAHLASDGFEAAVSVTTGTLANPLVRDDNSGKQLSGRIVFKPRPGMNIGASAARGPFVARSAADTIGELSGRYTQTAWGADIEYSSGYYLVRAEAILSDWRLPTVRPPAFDLPLRAVSSSVEGRYKIRPGLYAAARYDHLAFSQVTGTTRRAGWDAPVTRVEVGGGYALQRNLLVKLSFQRNTREATRVSALTALAAQAVFWF